MQAKLQDSQMLSLVNHRADHGKLQMLMAIGVTGNLL